MNNNAEKGFWISEAKLLPTLLIFSHLIKYDIPEEEINLIRYGLSGTSNFKEIFFSHHLKGNKNIDIKFARDHDNSDIIFMTLTFDKSMIAEIDLAVFILQEFELQYLRFSQDMSPS